MPNILLVEDDLMVCQLMARLLEDEGWQVDVCLEGKTAQHRLQGPKHYDLLITDEEFSVGSGLELVRHVRTTSTSRAQLPIIMFTSKPCADEAMKAGVNVFLIKPEDINVLVPTARGFIP